MLISSMFLFSRSQGAQARSLGAAPEFSPCPKPAVLATSPSRPLQLSSDWLSLANKPRVADGRDLCAHSCVPYMTMTIIICIIYDRK